MQELHVRTTLWEQLLLRFDGLSVARILTVASQKGGVGKTTTAVNLAACLSVSGARTLLFDLDPQGNASSGVGFPRGAGQAASSEAYLSLCLEGEPLTPFMRDTQLPGLLVLPACSELARLEMIQELQDRGFEAFRQQLRAAATDFDFVLVDCPPSLGGLPSVALGISDQVLIPVQCEYYAMEGLSQILPIIQKVKESTNPELSIGGLLLTMFCEELELSREVVREITDYFKDSVFRTIIPRDVVLAEAASHGLPAFQYAPLSRGAWSYVELAKEVLEHARE